jgi:hypothetical protein
MKRIFKNVIAIAASLFVFKSEAKNSEINNRVIRIRSAISEQVTNEKNTSAERLITYLEAEHDLTNTINTSANWNNWNWNNWNNWLKSTWNNWSKNSLPNWNNWLKSNWNNWMKF